jgi:hypothetical protein
LVNALVFNGKAVVERRGFRPKIFDDYESPINHGYFRKFSRSRLSQVVLSTG